MAVVNHPNPPHSWRDSEGNVDWDAYAGEADEQQWICIAQMRMALDSGRRYSIEEVAQKLNINLDD